MKKILLLTRNAWNDTNSTGNTASNLFKDFKENQLSNIYCRNEIINNNLCKSYYKITEKDILYSLLHGCLPGNVITMSNNNQNLKDIKYENQKMAFFRKYRFVILLWIREIIWLIPTWKNKKLDEYLKQVKPDIIYMPLFDSFYMYRILFYILKITNAKLVIFTGDDVYSLKKFSVSPFYWVNKFLLRRYIKKTINYSALRYCLTVKQKQEYENYFSKEFIQVTKSVNEEICAYHHVINDNPEKIVCYFGNLSMGRYNTLLEIGKIVDKNNIKLKFCIYCNSQLTKKELDKINRIKCITLKKAVNPNEVVKLQRNSDYLLHLESFKLKEKLQTRLSFSTKLTDYLGSGVPIIAVGWKKSAAMEFLINNSLAYTITSIDQIKFVLFKLNKNKDEEIVNNALKIVDKLFSKSNITDNFINKINSI